MGDVDGKEAVGEAAECVFDLVGNVYDLELLGSVDGEFLHGYHFTNILSFFFKIGRVGARKNYLTSNHREQIREGFMAYF